MGREINRWTKFDAALEAEKLSAERAEAQRNQKIDEVTGCTHRKHKGFFDTKCEHPDRQPGRQCNSLDCPVLFKETLC